MLTMNTKKKRSKHKNVRTCCGVVGGDIDMTNNEWHFFLVERNNNRSVNKIMNDFLFSLFIHTFYFSFL